MASVFLWCTGSEVPCLSSHLLIGLTPDVSRIAVLQTIAVSGFNFNATKGWVLAGFTSLLPSSNHAPKSLSLRSQEASSVWLISKGKFSNEQLGKMSYSPFPYVHGHPGWMPRPLHTWAA